MGDRRRKVFCHLRELDFQLPFLSLFDNLTEIKDIINLTINDRCINIEYWKKIELYMHFELFLCLGWTGLCWKRRHHFVQWNKNLKEMEEKSRQNFTENSRFIEILLFLQNLRPKSRQFFCLMQRFCCWDGTELDLLEASEVHESCEVTNCIAHCTDLTQTPPSSSNIEQPSRLFFFNFFVWALLCFAFCFTIFTIDSGWHVFSLDVRIEQNTVNQYFTKVLYLAWL